MYQGVPTVGVGARITATWRGPPVEIGQVNSCGTGFPLRVPLKPDMFLLDAGRVEMWRITYSTVPTPVVPSEAYRQVSGQRNRTSLTSLGAGPFLRSDDREVPVQARFLHELSG